MEYGSLHAPSNDLIELPIIGDIESTHEVSLEVVHNVIYARVEETLMIVAQSIEKSGLKDQLGAGIVLTGGFSRIDGIRELAVAIFDNMPVRLAKPNAVDGLFESLQHPEFSSAIGLVKYEANNFSRYEFDINKRMRHSNEEYVYEENIVLNDIANIEDELPSPVEAEESIKETLATIPEKKSSKSDDSGIFAKFWNWATQLF